MSPAFQISSRLSSSPSLTSLVNHLPRDSSSDIALSSSSPSTNAAQTIVLTASTNDISSPVPTHPSDINEKDSGYEYVTLSVTLPYTTYITTILLGDSFPTTSLVPTTYAVPTSSSNVKVQTPGIATGTIVGIVVGLIVGFLALFGVFYVYLLRARQAKRRRRRRRSRRSSSATADGMLL